MTNKITMKQYNEIKNKTYTMISYNLDTMRREHTTTADMLYLFEFQMIRPHLGHVIMKKETYKLIPSSIRYSYNSTDMKQMIQIAFNNRELN